MVERTEPDWRAEYVQAVIVADDLADLVLALRDRTVDAVEWIVSVPRRIERWEEWKRTRAPL